MVDKRITEQAFNHPILKSVFNVLTNNFINSNNYNYTPNFKLEVDFKALKKAIWLVSILSSSDNELYKERAQRFASLLFLTLSEKDENYPDIIRVCYVLFSRLGNLTGTKFFKGLYENWSEEVVSNPMSLESKFDFGELLSLELLYQRQDKTISTSNSSYLVTEFQKELWRKLLLDRNISVSAPTSSGKSFIIKQYLIEKYNTLKKFNALYVVPSRALINQVSEEFRVELNDRKVDVKTAYIDEDKDENSYIVNKIKKTLYILTPERCIKLLLADRENKIKLNFIFIDEIQGVEDEQGRGATFENVFEDLSSQFKKAKIVSAGPNINRPEKTFKELFHRESDSIQTSLSPVIQLKKIVRPVNECKIEVIYRDGINSSQVFSIDTIYNSLSFFKSKTNGKILQEVVNLIAPNDLNLIYCNRGDYSETWAREFQESKGNIKKTKRVKELISFLEDEFNSKYYLIDCLKKGIAFHHGKLPDIIRKEVEELFQLGEIESLFCTSTLLEGVNLPANNLFILTPKKNIDELTDFEFGNLIGRAGRLNKSLYGTIYFIEKPNYKGKKIEDYYDADYKKEIETFSSKSLPIYDFEHLSKSIHEIEEFKDNGKKDYVKTSRQKQITLFIRNKYVKSKSEIFQYLKRKGLSEVVINESLKVLSKQLDNLSIPKSIVLENQSIDPILQNELYLELKNNPIKNWVITPNSILEKRRKKEGVEMLQNEEKPMFWQLLTIFEGLDSIFNINGEIFEKYRIGSVNSTVMAIHATTWLQGLSFKELIDNDLRYYSTDERVPLNERINPNDAKDVNGLINRIIKINSSVVTFVLVKYTKLLVDILNVILSEEEKERYKMTLGLPLALELGTRDKNVKKLISSGISRTVAIKVAKKYVRTVGKNEREGLDITEWLSIQDEVKGLKPIYNRYLKRLRLLSDK